MNNGIDVKEVSLGVTFPQASIPIVLMQPLIKGFDNLEPYCWPAESVGIQRDAVRQTLEVALDRQAQFTIFPEYSLPGLSGLEIVDAAIRQDLWQTNSIVIAGVDGLDCEQYSSVWERLRPEDPLPGSEPKDLSAAEWVNCCVVWVKEASGHVRVFVQPKLTRARQEQQVRCLCMRTGQGVYIFRAEYGLDGYPCRFLCLICFDWIGVDGGVSALDGVLERIDEIWKPDPRPIHWVFVPQFNKKPCNPLFLNATSEFFHSGKYSFVERRDAVVVHSNSASEFRRAHRDSFGFSALVFHPNTFDCDSDRPATVCYRAEHLRQSDILKRCQDAVFREMGPCIHSMQVRVPKFARHDAAGRKPPVDNPAVHPLGSDSDARTPGQPVPAGVKWLHDCLDVTGSLAEQYPEAPLKSTAEVKQREVMLSWCDIECGSVEKRVLMATCVLMKEEDHHRNIVPDDWAMQEENALTCVVHASTIVAVGGTLSASEGSNHGRGEVLGKPFDIVVICGHSHIDCKEHFRLNREPIPNHPVFLVTRDKDNTPVCERTVSKITDVPGSSVRSEGITFTDPETHIKHVGYQQVLDWFINGDIESDIEKRLYELL